MALPKLPVNGKGSIKKLAKAGGVLGAGLVAVDTYSRVKEGQSVPVALGGALLTNALWSMVPGGVVGSLAIQAGMVATQLAPQIMNQMDQKRAAFNANRYRFGSNFQSTQAQQLLQTQGLNQISDARSALSAQMTGHARNAQVVY